MFVVVVAVLLATASAAPDAVIIVGDVSDVSARLLVDAFYAERVSNSSLDLLLREPGWPGSPPAALYVMLEVFSEADDSGRCDSARRDVELWDHARPEAAPALDGPCWRRTHQSPVLGACDAPHVLQLDGLAPATLHVGRVSVLVEGEAAPAVLGLAVWRTFAWARVPGVERRPRDRAPTVGAQFTVAVTSCDRFLQDGQSSTLEVLSARAWDRRATLMLGDQIYADDLDAEYGRLLRADHVDVTTPQVEVALLRGFRDMYRRSWSRPQARAYLRVGAHLGLADDHEIKNNFDDARVAQAEWQPLMRAGRQAFLEYQLRLWRDVAGAAATLVGPLPLGMQDAPPSWPTPGAPPGSRFCPAAQAESVSTGWTWRVWEGVALLLLDTRYSRAFDTGPRRQSSLLGDEQWVGVQALLDDWDADEEVTDVVVAAPAPLLVMTPTYAQVVDLAEAEKYPTHSAHVNATLALLARLWASRPKLRFLVAGDVHLGAHIDYCPLLLLEGAGGLGCIPQLVTSGLTVRSTVAHELKLFLFDWLSTYASSGAVADPAPGSTGLAWWRMHLRSIGLTENFALLSVCGPDANPDPSRKSAAGESEAGWLRTWCADYPSASPGRCSDLLETTPLWASALLDLLPGALSHVLWRALVAPSLMFAVQAPRAAGRLTWRLVVPEPDNAGKRLRVLVFQTTPLWLPVLLAAQVACCVRRCCRRAGGQRARKGRAG